MWESPIYSFNVPSGIDSAGKHVYRQVVIDVTGSAPSFDEPGKTLSKALRQVLAITGVGKADAILDFGAGKLRNALHLLADGHQVCAVEYEKLFDNSSQASNALARATKYTKRFARLLFPHQFVGSRKRFDLALLVNVLNVMPIPAERLAVLQLCHEKLRQGGHLLWYTQRGDRAYIERMVPKFRVGDGYFVGRNDKLKTFYREFTVAEIDQMLAASGFELVKPIAATSRNQARLYRRASVSAIADVITPGSLGSASLIDPRIPLPEQVAPRRITTRRVIRVGNPNPAELELPNLLREKLATIPVGPDSAKEYQLHVKAMLELLFKKELRHLELETDIFNGRKRLDILARNKSHSGFFHSIKVDQGMWCPYIVTECKNYRDEPGNPEFDQLGGRLGRKLGKVGVLAYRNTGNRSRAIARSADILTNDEKLVIPLSDRDFGELLGSMQDGSRDAIEDYLDAIVQSIRTA